jgi:hypothetical protein
MGDTSLEKPELTRRGKIVSLRAFIVNSRMAAEQEDIANAAISSARAAGTPVPNQPQLTSSQLAIEQNINYFLWGAEELYQHLCSYGFDSDWQAVSAYKIKQNAIGLAFAMGTAVELPCFEIGLSAEVGVTLTKTKYNLVLVQLVPAALQQKIYGTTDGDFTTNKQPEMLTIPKPLLISSLSGIGYKFKLSAQVEAVVEIGIPHSMAIGQKIIEFISKGLPEIAGEELSLSVSCKATAGMSLEMEYSYIADNFPIQYPDATSSEFKIELEANIGIGTRNHELKKIAETIATFYQPTAIKSPPNTQYNLVTQADKIRASSILTRSGIGVRSITQTRQLIAEALAYENSINPISVAASAATSSFPSAAPVTGAPNRNQIMLQSMDLHVLIMISDLFGEDYNRDIAKLGIRIGQLGYINGSSIAALLDGQYFINGQDDILVKVKNYPGYFKMNVNGKKVKIDYVNGTTAPENISKVNNIRLLPATNYNAKVGWKSQKKALHRTYLNYTSTEPKASASVSATVMSLGPELGAEAKTKFAKYRFQTNFNTNGIESIFLTQDIKVRYSRVTFNASITGKSVDKIAYNSISYRAVSGIWQENSLDQPKGVIAMPGSGMSFGATISYSSLDLFDPADRNEQASERVAKFASQLNISPDDFWDFITVVRQEQFFIDMQLDQADPAKKNAYKNRMFLIESTFSVEGFYCPVSTEPVEPGGSIKLSSNFFNEWMSMFSYPRTSLPTPAASLPTTTAAAPVTLGSSLQKCKLNSIYLRERLIDVDSIDGIGFKLGVTTGAVTASFEYTSSTDLGAEGVVNLYRFDALNYYGLATDPMVQNNNFIVPPAILFFQ